MKKKSSIIISSIAACAILASAFAFNGYAVENTNANSNVASVISTLQSLETPSTTTATETQTPATVQNKNQNTTTSDAKAVNVDTASIKNSTNNASCPKAGQTKSSNNQQTNIKSANLINNLQNAINNANCNKTTAKTRNYSALQSKLEALLKSNSVPSAAKPASKPSTSTPATKPTTNVPTNGDYSAFQKKVVELVNVERSKNGLKPLTMNTELSKVATLKSQDMAKLNYFDHNSPTYGSPFDMMKKYGISYRTAGENIAMGQSTPEQVMQGWMNSPGHRANILKASFTQIGVGIAKNSSGRLYWTQQFIG